MEEDKNSKEINLNLKPNPEISKVFSSLNLKSPDSLKDIPIKRNQIRQEQVHDILFSREIGWQDILYDLINTEQLDPWDIDITILTEKYLEKIRQLEEMDFFISSKVLLAAALLLRIKSEILLNRYIKSIDDILFGKEEKKKSSFERIELDEEIPGLIPRSPMPRFKKVTLKELIESLNKAIITENRRIKKTILDTNALRETSFSLPKSNYNIKDKIKEVLGKINFHFTKNKEEKRMPFTHLTQDKREEKIACFFPLLHLENQEKLWLEQTGHFEEIYIWMKHIYFKHNPDPFKELKEELAKELKELNSEERARLEEVSGFDSDLIENLAEDSLVD
jgi:segregation and condensation protein A